MASIKERAAALNLEEKLCVRPNSGQVIKPVNNCLLWSSLIVYLKSTVTIKTRRVHIKAHSDCFLGSEAVDVVAEHLKLSKKFEEVNVTREKVICVCQALLDCNVFEVPGTKPLGKGKKQVFQDSKRSLYRSEEQTTSHVEMPVASETDCLTLKASMVSPSGSQTELKLPQTLVDEVWQELTLLRLLNLVEIPVLDGILQCSPSPRSPQKTHQLTTTNLDLAHSSNHLDRKVLKAFKDSQDDEWLYAALDCLDFLPDQSVVDLSRKLPHCFSEVEIQKPSYEQPLLSSSNLDNYKLLVYGALSKHYSHTDRAPLLPQHMTDIYKAITELLVTAKLDTALEALQLCLKLLLPNSREELRRLLTFMALAVEPQAIRLEMEVENRLAIKRSFSRAILHCKDLTKEKEDIMVVFMLCNIQEIFKIPGALHKEVSDKLALLVQGQQTDVTGSTFCQQVPKRTYVNSTKTTTNNELWKLLDSINVNVQISNKERKRLLGQFYQAHPEVFNQYFGDSAASIL
uniref:DEP domain-containing protein 7 n=1 Tax=Neogobius melanostomus TaxID=47308 RepID=A0A8C6UT56_9GOBI